MRDAEIAVERAAQVAVVEADKVMFACARLVQGPHAFSAKAGIKGVFVGVEARRHTNESGRKQTAEQNKRKDGREFSSDVPGDLPLPDSRQHALRPFLASVEHPN